MARVSRRATFRSDAPPSEGSPSSSWKSAVDTGEAPPARESIPGRLAAMRTRPVSPALGAVIEEVHLTPDMDEGTVRGIREALLQHKVVWFRGQSLDGASLTAVATRFGTPTEAHPVEPSLEGHPEVLPLDSEEGARADVWHSDLTFQECPPLGAILHALEIPPVGGDTIWADMADAYRALSTPMQSFLDGLTATHSPTKAGGYFAEPRSHWG